jgi:hypothetical protein
MYVTQQNFDQGRRALERFRKLIAVRYRPLLRAVTGNPKLEVEPHASMAFTDNKTVWLPVPFALGEETLEHDKTYCGQRDPDTLLMLCPFCAVEDEVDGIVLHESAHITELSFAKMPWRKVHKMVTDVFGPTLDALDPDRRKALIDKLSTKDDAMEVASILDAWLPFATNVVEDVYVNRRLFGYREGSELPLRLYSKSIFEDGVKSADGKLSHWKDNDPSAQAIISAYLVGQNMPELGDHLDPKCNLTQDPGVQALVGAIPFKCDVEDRLKIAMELLLHLRDLGFCPPKSDSAVTPPMPPNPDGASGEPQPPSPGAETQEEQSPGEGDSGEEEQPQDDGESQSEGGSDSESDDGDDEAETGNGQGDDDGEEEGDDDATGKGGQAADDDDDEGDIPSGESSESDAEGGEGQESEASESSSGDDGGQETTESSKDGEAEKGDDDSWEPPTDDEIEEQLKRAKELLTYVMGHEDTGPSGTTPGSQSEKMTLERVLKQEGFDHHSEKIGGIEVKNKMTEPYKRMNLDTVKRVEVPRSMLTPSVSRLRVVFAQNRKTGLERSLKSGPRLDPAHLARAGYEEQPRIFGRHNVPKNRDWFVLVGIDMSSSTRSNGADYAEKMAGHAVGDLLHTLGIRFAMYTHTACSDANYKSTLLEIVEIKRPDQNWKERGVQEMLFAQSGRSTNLDGHTLEQYRKMILAERATDKLLLYFTDGEMPGSNFDEELVLLKENIEILRRNRVNLIGCGYRTDSPSRHGLDTIQYNEPNDVKSIVEGLEARLLR